jgi:hypothetical protein
MLLNAIGLIFNNKITPRRTSGSLSFLLRLPLEGLLAVTGEDAGEHYNLFASSASSVRLLIARRLWLRYAKSIFASGLMPSSLLYRGLLTGAILARSARHHAHNKVMQTAFISMQRALRYAPSWERQWERERYSNNEWVRERETVSILIDAGDGIVCGISTLLLALGTNWIKSKDSSSTMIMHISHFSSFIHVCSASHDILMCTLVNGKYCLQKPKQNVWKRNLASWT